MALTYGRGVRSENRTWLEITSFKVQALRALALQLMRRSPSVAGMLLTFSKWWHWSEESGGGELEAR
jgi:hypothetical protein